MRQFIDIVDGRIDELFPSKFRVNWIQQSRRRWVARFLIRKCAFHVTFERGRTGAWHVAMDYDFDSLNDKDADSVLLNDEPLAKHQKKSGEIFGRTVAAVKDFIRQTHPHRIAFNPKTASHGKLYRALIRRFETELKGAGYISAQDGEMFTLELTEGKHTPLPDDPDDAEHWDALDKTGFFGNQGAGCIPMSRKTGKIMLVLRSASVEQPHTWGGVGGAHKAEERPVDAAQRELHEETGYSGPKQMIPLFVFQSGSFRYCNFLALVEDEFVPDLGWEADDYKWVTLDDLPSPIHFGLEAVFNDAQSRKVLQHYSDLCGGK